MYGYQRGKGGWHKLGVWGLKYTLYYIYKVDNKDHSIAQGTRLNIL